MKPLLLQFQGWKAFHEQAPCPFGQDKERHVTNLSTRKDTVLARLQVGQDAMNVFAKHIDPDNAELKILRFDEHGEKLDRESVTLPMTELEGLTLFEMVVRVYPEWVRKLMAGGSNPDAKSQLLAADLLLNAPGLAPAPPWF